MAALWRVLSVAAGRLSPMPAGDALGRQWTPSSSLYRRDPEYPTTMKRGRPGPVDQPAAARRMRHTARWEAHLEATRKGVFPSKN